MQPKIIATSTTSPPTTGPAIHAFDLAGAEPLVAEVDDAEFCVLDVLVTSVDDIDVLDAPPEEDVGPNPASGKDLYTARPAAPAARQTIDVAGAVSPGF